MNVYKIGFEHDSMGQWEEVVVAPTTVKAIDKALASIQKDAQTKNGWELLAVAVLHKDVITVR